MTGSICRAGPARASTRGKPTTASVDTLVLALGTLGLLFVGLMAVAGFTVMAQRRLRALGMLASLGATDKHVRLVLLADGAAVGLAGAIAGGVAGLAAWFAFAPTLQSLSGHRIDRFDLPWWAIGASLILAALTAVAAAWWPARAVARTSVVAALSGRPPRPQPAHRFAAAGTVLLAGGLALLVFSDHGSNVTRPAFIIIGTVATAVGLLFLAPLAIRVLARVSRRAGIAVRLALRDLVRYQARSGAALGSVTLAIGIAAAIAISAAASDAPTASGQPPHRPADDVRHAEHRRRRRCRRSARPSCRGSTAGWASSPAPSTPKPSWPSSRPTAPKAACSLRSRAQAANPYRPVMPPPRSARSRSRRTASRSPRWTRSM